MELPSNACKNLVVVDSKTSSISNEEMFQKKQCAVGLVGSLSVALEQRRDGRTIAKIVGSWNDCTCTKLIQLAPIQIGVQEQEDLPPARKDGLPRTVFSIDVNEPKSLQKECLGNAQTS